MGLSIGYELRASASVEEARELVRRLHERAVEVGFVCEEVREFSGEEAVATSETRTTDPEWWLKIRGGYCIPMNNEESDKEYISLDPLHMIAFMCWPGKTEPSCMGLCRLPAKARRKIDGRSIEFDTGFGDIWAWQSSCKTQYASDPQNGGIEHFLDSHIRLIALLDFAKDLGILHDVGDDGGYWLDRDRQKLASEIHRWNVKVAGIVGTLNDLFEGQGKDRGSAAITKFLDFEHLEAEAHRDKEPGGDEA